MMRKKGSPPTEGFDELRNRARDILKRSSQAVIGNSGSCLENLQEELGIYNVELEIQCEELRQARERLESSQRYLSDLFQHSPVGYVVLTTSGLVQDVNEAASADLMLSKELLRGQRLQAYVPHNDLFNFNRCFKNVLEFGSRQSCEVSFRTRKGHDLHARLEFMLLKSDDRFRETVVLCALQDIGRQKLAERVLAERNMELESIIERRTSELLEANRLLSEENSKRLEAQQRAERAASAKTHFLAQMSHEIRTPLNGVLGMLQLLEVSELDDDQRRLVATAKQSGGTLLGLINDLLDLSKVESGALKFNPQPFSPGDVIQALVGVTKPSVRDKGLALQAEIDPRLPGMVLGDRLRFEQIVSNLLGNSLKFTRQGEVRIGLSLVHLDEANNTLMAHLLVSDSGVGIEPSRLERVFEPFTHFDAGHAASREGAGLGLGIVKHLVEQMDGAVRIESTPGVGTRVHCSLRFGLAQAASELPEPDEAGAASGAQNQPSRDTLQGLRVLLAEDNPVNELFAVRVLTQANCEVEVAHNGREALDKLRHLPFDIVLMDVEMPEMNGVEASKAIRGDKTGKLPKNIPIIALTAYALPEDRERFLAVGMNDMMAKPFEREELLALAAKLCGR